MGQGGLPRREMTFIYVVWTLATLAVAGYGVATSVWQLMLVSVAFNALETAGTIVWATVKQRNVPVSLLGRVSSLDWLISIGLLPLSLALTGPISGAIGARSTLIGAGVVGGAVTLAALYLPGMRAVETTPVVVSRKFGFSFPSDWARLTGDATRIRPCSPARERRPSDVSRRREGAAN